MKLHAMRRCGWGLVRGLAAAPLLCLLVSSASAEDWVELYDSNQNEIMARIVAVEGESVTIERQRDKKIFQLPLERLSSDSQDLVRQWDKSQGKSTASGRVTLEIPTDLPKRLYPRSLEEIDEGLNEILSRPGPSGFDQAQVDAVNKLNAYRFLSGVPAKVGLDRTKVTEATDAANACQEHGSLSHNIGHSTNVCNLHRGQTSHAASVRGYIDDPGANNREARGHRRWCLNPPMEEVGFGESEDREFFAMWAMDKGGKGLKEIWAYPGEGLYPLSYLHGNGWSCYLPGHAPSAGQLEVEVFRLDSRPEKPFNSSEEIPGEKLPVPFVHTFLNAINFEPTGSGFSEPGIFYVRIKGGGVKESYLVELIDR